MRERPITFFIDLDGCLRRHLNEGGGAQQHNSLVRSDAIEGSRETIDLLDKAGHRIIIVTGQPEIERELVTRWLRMNSIRYHQLIMDCTGGCRIVVNDAKPDDDTPTCCSVMVVRNEGITCLKEFA